MKKNLFLYLIIILEGYVVLSAELIAIRQMIPFVGSGTDTTAIIIAAVLCPMALGYYVGGNSKTNKIRKSLLRNIFIATIILIPGLSYILTHDFMQLLPSILKPDRLHITTIYSAIFLVVPVFLLAQTIPLVSHYFGKKPLPSTTGKILFFSTIGSLFGAVFSTLFLMPNIGVHHTAFITIFCLCFLYIVLSKKKFSKSVLSLCLISLFAFHINSNSVLKKIGIIRNDQYHTIQITERPKKGRRILRLNGNLSAGYAEKNNESFFQYMKYINKIFIAPIQNKEEIRSILVIGSGGFTIGLDDNSNDYTFVDINGALKDISEQYFIKQKLGDNKKFHPMPARAFIQQAINNGETFDLIVSDVYLGYDIPEHLLTKEFFESTKKILKKDGIVTFNLVVSTTFNDRFSINIDNTLRAVFPNITRQILKAFNPWKNEGHNTRNVLYTYVHKDYGDEKSIYTDDKNRVVYDQP